MRASLLLLASLVVISLPAATIAQFMAPGGSPPGDCKKPGPDKPICPGPGKPGWPCWPSTPGCWPYYPTGCGWYGGGWGTWRPPSAIYPPVYVDGPYDTSMFSPWPAGWGRTIPYYDTNPVQYAYTPIDIPPTSPVVRPQRESTHLRALPRQVRRPLYELSRTQRRPDGQN